MRIELIAEIEGQKIKGLSQMKALADKGNIEALNLLGEWMMMGFECSPDPDYYVNCFKEAARKGNTQGMLNLAVCYMEERGVPADFYAAERWIRAAIEGGDREGIELFKELYLTTIGTHKPDVRAYVRTMKEFDPTGALLGEKVGSFERFWMSEEELEQRLMANLVLGSRGKSVKEIRKIKNKLTDADIEGYARLQDIHHEETEATPVERDYAAEKVRIIRNLKAFIPGTDREQILLAIKAITKLVSADKSQKRKLLESAQRCLQTCTTTDDFDMVLGVLNMSIKDQLKKFPTIISDLSIDKQTILLVKTLVSSLNWRTKATFDVDSELFEKFEPSELVEVLTLIGDELDRIENSEIQAQYVKCNNDWKALLAFGEEIKATKYYGTDVSRNWRTTINERIAELQDREVATTFARDKNKYLAMVALVNLVMGKNIASSIKEKWLAQLQEVTISLQHTELESLCTNLAGKQLNELYQIEAKADKYDFDKKTLSAYKVQLTEAIEAAQNQYMADRFESAQNNYDDLVALHAEASGSKYYTVVATAWREKISAAISYVQRSELQKLLTCMDSLGYAELIKLRQRAEHYSFDADVLSSALKPLDEIIDQKEKAHLDELCAGVEGYSVARLKVLEEKINALHYRESNTKKPLAQIRKLIKSNGLLEKCTPGRLANCEPDQLDSLMQEVHFSSLPKEEKERIFALIVKQREANENYEAEILQTIENSQNELTNFIKSEFSTLKDILYVYANDEAFRSQTEHIPRDEWNEDEVPVVYVKKGRGLDCLLTNKAIRRNGRRIIWLTDFVPLKVDGPEYDLVIKKPNGDSVILAWGKLTGWDRAGGEKVAFVFNRSVQKIKDTAHSRESKIRAIKHRHQTESTMLDSEAGSAFSAFARRYSPDSIINFSAEQITESKETVQQSQLSAIEQKAILHILSDAERCEKRIADAVATYDRNFCATSCKGVREIATKYLGAVPPMIYNDTAEFRRGIDSIKVQYKNSSIHNTDYGDMMKNGICILMCGGRGGAFVVFKRYSLHYYSASDAHTSTGWGVCQYADITKIIYNRVGFTHAPEIAIFEKDDSRHYTGVSVTGQSADTVTQMAKMCSEIVDYLGNEILVRKDNAREEDRKSIAAYFEKARKDLAVFYASAWEAIIASSRALTPDQFSAYLSRCVEYEKEYYEKHPLKLSFDYYVLKKPTVFTPTRTSGSDNVAHQTKPTFTTNTPAGAIQPVKCSKCGARYLADMSACPTCGHLHSISCAGATPTPQTQQPGERNQSQTAQAKSATAAVPVQPAQKPAATSAPHIAQSKAAKQQLAVLDIAQLKQMAEQLKISNILDFDNVDIQEFLNSHPGYNRSGQVVVTGEYGVVLVKNLPEPILLTNTSYYSVQHHFGNTDLYHTHPAITAIPFSKYKVVYSKVSKSNALKYDYRETVNGVSPRMEGEIPSTLDSNVLNNILQFLNYAAYGTKPAISASAEAEKEPTAPTPTSSTQANSIDAFREKGLAHLEKKISELTDTELYEAMLALALKHRPRSYLTVGTDAFNSKISKALAAYARVPVGEKILVMEDQTIFGSAKEGFVLTDKHIYINISGCKNKCVTISEITNVFNTRGTGLTDVMVSTLGGNYRLSYRSEIADGDACTAFLAELIQYLNSNCATNAPAAQTAVPTQAQAAAPVQPATPAPASVLKWQCGCGSINSGNFCAKCGGKKENGTPLWTCVCGSVNKGKFCTKCGSPKKEG